MREAMTDFYALFPPTFLSFFKVFSQPLLSDFNFLWRQAKDFVVFGISLAIFFFSWETMGGGF